MATNSPLQAMRNPGRVVVDPTDGDLTGTFPYGGTEIGRVVDVKGRRIRRFYDETAEEWGGETSDRIYLGEEWRFMLALRGFDSDGVALTFENATDSSTAASNEPIVDVTWPETTNPDSTDFIEGHSYTDVNSGTNMAPVKMVFVPNDSGRKPAVYFRSAVPHTVEDLEFFLHRKKEMLVLVEFQAFRASTANGSVQVRALRNIVL